MHVKHIISLFLIIIFAITLSACTKENNDAAWNNINSGALLVDVRSAEEFEQGHLEGALLIPHKQVSSRIDAFGADKSQPIVLYCKSGGRAGKALRVLEENGYTNVINAGGYKDLLATMPNKNTL